MSVHQKLVLSMDMRYEETFRKSLAPANGSVLKSIWIILRDQVLFNFGWGFGWALARDWFQLARIAGAQAGTRFVSEVRAYASLASPYLSIY